MTNDITKLLPIVSKKCVDFIDACNKQGIQIVVTGTLRTIAEQDALYAQGRTRAGSIVTQAKGGQSLHNWGVAFDCCPVTNGKLDWNNDALFQKMGKIGQSLGLEWGGAWTSFVDKPHFQYTLGYTWQDFQADKVDLSRFNLKTMEPNTPDTHTPQTHEELNAFVGKATLYEVVNKETGVVSPVDRIGSGDEDHDGDTDFFVHLAEQEIVFTAPGYQNDTYIVRQRGTNLLPNNQPIA